MISSWVEQHAAHIDAALGPVLDLACGAGRHTEYLASLGLHVIALDRDEASLKSLASRGFQCVNCDLEAPRPDGDQYGDQYVWPFAVDSLGAIIVTNYLHRPLLPSLLASIKPGGILIYETFAVGHEAYGRPKNPLFLLQENELLWRCVFEAPEDSNFVCLAFEHGLVNQSAPAIVQRICVRRI